MSYINFIIPHSKQELLEENPEQYYVRNVVTSRELLPKLRDAKQCLKDEGPEFILQNYDVYFSVLMHGETLSSEIITRAFDDLNKAVSDLDRNLNYLLEDKESLNDELKNKYLNILKMLIYVYTNMVILIEQKNSNKAQTNLKKSKKSDRDEFSSNKNATLLLLNNIMQREIEIFWDPPVTEAMFVNLIAEVAYRFLEIPSIKSDKDARLQIFSLLGLLVTKHNHGNMFIMRLVNLTKLHEHLTSVVPEGIRFIVTNYNCKGLLRDFVKEITEWQTDEKFCDTQGSRLCCTVLSEMATLMPDLMLPEVAYLNDYLGCDFYVLRISILNIMVEVIMNVLTKDNLMDEERENRDFLLSILEEHMWDTSGQVRSKVFQFWTKLQSNHAVPIKLQTVILEKAIPHLQDKAALARKNAANLVTTFLNTNPFCGELQLSKFKTQLEEEKTKLTNCKLQLQGVNIEEMEDALKKWTAMENDILAVAKNKINEEIEEPDEEISEADLPDILRQHLLEGEYEKALNLVLVESKKSEEFKNLQEDDKKKKIEMIMKVIKTIFVCSNLTEKNKLLNEDEMNELELLERSVNFFEHAVSYLQLIDDAITPMKLLLESQAISDMQEAINFFVFAFQFKIERGQEGIYAMLKMMKRNDAERKSAVIEAFRKIYLTTDAFNMEEHTKTIVERLIDLVRLVPVEFFEDLCAIVAQWVANGTLDNNIVGLLWNYVSGRVTCSEEHMRLAMDLLYMSAQGRWTIIERNKELVQQVVFGNKETENMLLVRTGCRFLSLYASKTQSVMDKEAPLRIPVTSGVWEDLITVLVNNFTKKIKFYNIAMTEAISFIYKACSAPDRICENLIKAVFDSLVEKCTDSVDGLFMIRLNHMIGEIALRHLVYMDNTVYKELKRRNNLREERKNQKKKVNKKSADKSASSQRNKRISMNATLNATMNGEEGGSGDELEGAQGCDTDAEFILHILENYTVTANGGLGKFAPLIVKCCENLDTYKSVYVQNSFVTALLRFMIVSGTFCENHLRLVFTILERTQHIEIKCHILIYYADMLERFPNILEPWTPRVYERLKEENFKVRRTAFFVLANLILRDMIRVQTHIAQMALVLEDKEEVLKDMSKEFFITLAQKGGNNLYFALPDIFAHLLEEEKLPQDSLRDIMKFLFSLIDKNKHMENFVDRFCLKLQNNDDEYKFRNTVYCLTLINFNEKGLKHLSENFKHYKHILHDQEVYSFFKNMLANALKQNTNNNKQDLKGIVAEIEAKIESVFEITENGEGGSKTPPPKPVLKKTKPAPKSTRGRGGRGKKKVSSDSSDSEDDRGRKPKPRGRGKRKISSSDSD